MHQHTRRRASSCSFPTKKKEKKEISFSSSFITMEECLLKKEVMEEEEGDGGDLLLLLIHCHGGVPDKERGDGGDLLLLLLHCHGEGGADPYDHDPWSGTSMRTWIRPRRPRSCSTTSRRRRVASSCFDSCRLTPLSLIPHACSAAPLIAVVLVLIWHSALL